MESSWAATLVITAIGMSLLFLSLVLFYGIISLLTAVTRERPAAHPARTDGAEGQRDAPEDRALQAAAIAIALARAQAEARPGSAGDCAVSPWWSLHHQHRLAEKTKPRRLD